MSVGHSDLKRSAPVREPSPPHTTSASIPSLIRLYAAIRRPSGVRNAFERAVPISVPPYSRVPHKEATLSIMPTYMDKERKERGAPLRTNRARHPTRRARCSVP